MTTVTLPPRPVAPPEFKADPAGVSAFGTALRDSSASFDDLGTYGGSSASDCGLEGESGTAYATDARSLGQRNDALSLGLRAVATAVMAHADELESLQRVANDLEYWYEELLATVLDLERRGRSIPAEEMAEFAAQCESVTEQVKAHSRDVEAWQRDLQRAEQAITRAFAKAATAEKVEAAYVGVTDPADAAIADKPDSGASPEGVNEWWTGLSEEDRQAVIAAYPEEIGNLDGVPAWARNEANTRQVNRDIDRIEQIPEDNRTDDEQTRYENAVQASMALDRVRNATDPRTGEHYEPQLYIYDPLAFDGDGAVAVSVGDLDTAENVSVTVPGFGTDAADIDGNTQKAINVQQAASEAGGTSTASLIWIGYDAPDNLTGDAAAVTNEHLAENGGDRLADTFDGLNAMRSDDFHLTAIGHSYGSTTTAHALTDHDVDVDDAVLVGSPGAGGGVEHADELDVNNDVWVGANSRDPVAALADNGWAGGWLAGGAGLGNDPAEDDFGVNRFQAEDVDRGDYIRTFPQHTSYFDHDSESLYNIARVVNGDYDEVEGADHTYDPWNKGPQDPEADRTPTSPDTNGDGEVDTKDD